MYVRMRTQTKKNFCNSSNSFQYLSKWSTDLEWIFWYLACPIIVEISLAANSRIIYSNSMEWEYLR